MSPRLHVLLGAGGVGKTTLAAGYALALARQGRRVGLLGIDPARRLGTALGLVLDDEARAVPAAGALEAAALVPAQALPRWAREVASPEVAGRLATNAFFVALAERLATANDVFAAIRVAEWLERDPTLEDLVVDTAPGENAIEFLRRPEALSAFLEGPLVGSLRRLSRAERHGLAGRVLHRAAERALTGLGRIGGSTLLLELGDFLALAEEMLERMAERLGAARRAMASASTEMLLVAALRDDAADTARAIASALAPLGFRPHATVVNRVLDPALGAELARCDPSTLSPTSRAIVQYARAEASLQARVVAELSTLSPRTVLLPAARSLEGEVRRSGLLELGERLRRALSA